LSCIKVLVPTQGGLVRMSLSSTEWATARLQTAYMLVDPIPLAFREHNTVSIDRLLKFGSADSTELR
jgi:hypothetical protein